MTTTTTSTVVRDITYVYLLIYWFSGFKRFHLSETFVIVILGFGFLKAEYLYNKIIISRWQCYIFKRSKTFHVDNVMYKGSKTFHVDNVIYKRSKTFHVDNVIYKRSKTFHVDNVIYLWEVKHFTLTMLYIREVKHFTLTMLYIYGK